jgi:hypothetical protein
MCLVGKLARKGISYVRIAFGHPLVYSDQVRGERALYVGSP